MDANDLRMLATVLGFLCFIGIVAWAWQRKNRERFDEAAQLPFADEADSGAQGGRRPLYFRPNSIDRQKK